MVSFKILLKCSFDFFFFKEEIVRLSSVLPDGEEGKGILTLADLRRMVVAVRNSLVCKLPRRPLFFAGRRRAEYLTH